MGLFSSIAGPFMAVQERRAAGEAAQLLQRNQQLAFNLSAQFGEQGDQFLKDFRTYSGEDRQRIQELLAQTQGIEVTPGLSAADKIALEDAQRLMNENLVGTGNLRSGAAGFYNMELARRAAADASERYFNRSISKMNVLFGGVGQGQQTSGIVGSVGMGLKEGQRDLFKAGLSFAGPLAETEIRKGAANANLIGSYANLGDMLVTTGTMGYLGLTNPGLFGASSATGGATTGALFGSGSGGPMMNLMMLNRLFGPPAPGESPYKSDPRSLYNLFG